MATQTGSYDFKTAKAAHDDAATTATNYITNVTSDGIMVHAEGEGPDDTQTPTGWHISDVLELIKSGVTYIKAWLNGNTPTVQIGASANGNYALIDDDSFDIYHGDTQMVHFGYGEGNADDGTKNAPYYTLGERATNPREYSSSSTYRVCDHVLYNGVEYVCIVAIDTPKAFDANDWQQAIGNMSVAEGARSTASGYASHAEGEGTTAIGFRSHAEGSNTVANGIAGHAEGEGAKASGTASHAEGRYTVASGVYGHAEGVVTTASGSCSHAQNANTIAASRCQTAIGEYNIEDANGKYALIIGNGLNGSWRSNALAVDWEGTVYRTTRDAEIGATRDSTLWNNLIIASDDEDGFDSTGHVHLREIYQTDGRYGWQIEVTRSDTTAGTRHNGVAAYIDNAGNPTIGFNYPDAWRNALGINDYITAHGTSGIWTYRKWASGIAECWGRYSASMAINTATTGYGGYRSGQFTLALPSGLFNARPIVTATASSSQGFWVNNLADTSATAVKFYLSSSSSLAAATRTVDFHVSGKWK